MSKGFRIVYATYINSTQSFIQDFQFWGGGGGDVVCGLTGMGEYFSQVTPRMVLKALWFHFADK